MAMTQLILLLRRVLLAMFLLASTSCARLPLATPVEDLGATVMPSQLISVDSIEHLSELATLAGATETVVAAITFTADSQSLLAVYANEAGLYEWRLDDSTQVRHMNVGTVGLGGVSFDAAGRRIATSAGADWENHLDDDRYLGWQVWDIATGKLISEHGKTYDSVLSRRYYPDIQLNPDGSWVLLITVSAHSDLRSLKDLLTMGLDTNQNGGAYVDFSRRPEEDDFDVIAIDAQGAFFAAADEAGQVGVYLFEPLNYPKQPQLVLRQPSQLGPRPLALAFDPRRHWLAEVRGNQLTVWNLQAASNRAQLSASLGEVMGLSASLAFNPQGDLLAVGTASGLQLWDVQGKALVAQLTETGVYAVAFGDDGRRLAWGDAEGTIHVWGLPEAGN
jgi:hypothetical protein